MNLLRPTLAAACLSAGFFSATAMAAPETPAPSTAQASSTVEALSVPNLAKRLRAMHVTKSESLGSFSLAATTPSPPPPPPPAPSGCAVAGNYTVTGNNPGDARPYHGTATISTRDGGCYMRWSAPNSSEGTGTYYNGQLKITFWGLGGGGGGIVIYNGRPGGSLSGVWWTHGQEGNQGNETLTPN